MTPQKNRLMRRKVTAIGAIAREMRSLDNALVSQAAQIRVQAMLDKAALIMEAQTAAALRAALAYPD